MRKKLTYNFSLKILALIFSTVIWFVIVSKANPVTTTEFKHIPVDITNAEVITDEGRVIEVLDGTDTVNVTVRAKRSILKVLSKDDIKVTADMTKLSIVDTVMLEGSSRKYSDQVTVTPKTEYLKIKIEDLATKNLPIEVDTEGTPEQGYAAGTAYSEENVVVVSGPISVISKIVGAVAVADVSGRNSQTSVTVPITLVDSDGAKVESPLIECNITQVRVTVEMLATKDVFLAFETSGVPAAGYGIKGGIEGTPNVVQIAGKGSVFDNLAVITVPGEALDITGALADVETTVNITKYLPVDVKLANNGFDGNVTVKISISKDINKIINVPVSNISFINVPQGYTASLEQGIQSVGITIGGNGDGFTLYDGISTLGVIDIGKIDFQTETLEPGVYEIKPEFNLPTGIKLIEQPALKVTLIQGSTLPIPVPGGESGTTQDTADAENDSGASVPADGANVPAEGANE